MRLMVKSTNWEVLLARPKAVRRSMARNLGMAALNHTYDDQKLTRLAYKNPWIKRLIFPKKDDR